MNDTVFIALGRNSSPICIIFYRNLCWILDIVYLDFKSLFRQDETRMPYRFFRDGHCHSVQLIKGKATCERSYFNLIVAIPFIHNTSVAKVTVPAKTSYCPCKNATWQSVIGWCHVSFSYFCTCTIETSTLILAAMYSFEILS